MSRAVRFWSRIAIGVFCLCELASAQMASNPDILITPFGIWQVCEGSLGAANPLCNGFTPGSEQFLLLIKASKPETTEFLYTVIATMQDGSTRAVSGQLKRKDNGAGYTSTTLYFGGIAVAFNTTVEEATIAAVQTGTGTFQP